MTIHPEHKSLRLLLTAVIFLSGLTLLGVHAQAQDETTSVPKKRLIGDYGYWSKYQTPPYSAAQIPYKKLTHIIHFNIGFNSDGTLSVPDGFLEPALLRKAHAAGVKVLLGLGGPFPALDGHSERIAALVGNLWAFIYEHGYDGVDIDWEYPTAEQADTFYSLFVALRTAFPDPTYELSADVPPWAGTGYAMPQVNPYLNYFNIMMYDCAGPWTADGQLNSEIVWDPTNTDPYECQPGGAANEAVAIFREAGVDASQLNMGTPFYGYVYTNVSALWGPCSNIASNGDCDGVFSENYGTFIKQRINQMGWETFYDLVALVPYMLRQDGQPGYITYDDIASTYDRVWYSDWRWHLGGTFMWSLDADYDGHSQDLLDAMYTASLGPGN